jgi:type I restriction enzyme S subunit
MKLEEFARESRATHKGDKSGVPIVGLEHLIPQEIKFSGYDVDTENTFTKTFKKGQILFGRRRAYLKKAAIADFDGICSGDITVIEAIPGKVDPLLLPFIIQNDKFFDYAVSRSAGGLSPRVKWEHLKDYEFDLPPIEEQRILADKLWAAYRLKESYKKLLTATQEMVKSQFIEMYYNTHNKQTLESVCPIMNKGITPKYVESSSVLVINQACIHWDGQRLGNIKYHNEEIPVRKRILESGDVLLNATGNGTLGRCCVFICPSDNNTYINDGHVIALSTDRAVILPEVLNTYLSLNDTQAEIYRQYVTGSTNQVDIVFSDIKKMKVPVPSMDEQILFVEVLTQADKSKFGDFKSQFIEMFGNPLSLNQKNELKRLGECCILNPRRPNIALCDTDKVSFIPMPAVSEDGYLVDMTDEEYGKVKKGFTYFENNDVLFAKITPCMENGKGAIVHGLTNGIGMGSTEFHVLRPINGISSPYWLLALTRMPIFRERAAKNMSGTGGQKRVSASYLDHFMVGLPAMEEQRRFEAIYRQADKSKSVIQKALVYLNDIQSDELGKIA